MNITNYPQYDFSGGVQDATTFLLRKSNELKRGANLRFGEDLGGFERRLGFQAVGSPYKTVTAGTTVDPQGAHSAKFSTGSVKMVATNNTAGTATIIRSQATDGTWSDLSGLPTWPKDSILFFFDYMDECYVSGFDPLTGDPIQPVNIDKTLNVSTTRNLIGCPNGYFFADFNGVLYIANLKYNGTRYASRVQKGSPPLGAVTYIQGAQSGSLTTILVDSVRYLKVGNSVTFYAAGTDTAIGSAAAITAVDKVNNKITISAQTLTLADNDEVWLTGTKGRLNVFWNTDYPNPQTTGEFLEVKQGADSNNAISGIRQAANRLFIWTKNSGSRYDGNSLVVFNNSVGCISHRSIRTIDDDWIIWVDSKGNVRARNENAGQAQVISRPVRKIMRKLTQAQLKAVSGGIVDQVYKLNLGLVDGQYVRLCYDFDSNLWSPDRLGYPAVIQFNDDSSGDLKPYFISNNGKLYMDEIGNKDDDKAIPFEAGTGPDIFQSYQTKRYTGILLFTENCNGLKLEASVDMDRFQTVGIIGDKICYMDFPQNGDNVLPEGRAFDWQIMGSGEQDPPRIIGAVIFYVPGGAVPQSERRS